MEPVHFQEGERRQTEAEQASDVNFHEDQAQPLKFLVIDHSPKKRRIVYYKRHISFELHYEEFHDEADVITDVKSVPQREENKRGDLREVLVTFRSENRVVKCVS